MKRLFSLLLLLWCSLTLCGAAALGETWRLTNDGVGNKYPHIATNNTGNTRVVWLSNKDGDYDIMVARYAMISWESLAVFHEDSIDQTTCSIAGYHGSNVFYLAWDSAGVVQAAKDSTDPTVMDVSDSTRPLLSDSDIHMAMTDQGGLHVCWSKDEPFYGWHASVFLRSYNGLVWDTIEMVFNGVTTSDADVYLTKGIVCQNNERPHVLAWNLWDGLVWPAAGGGICFSTWQGDSIWQSVWSDSWDYPPSAAIGISYANSDTLLVAFCDNANTDTATIICKRYSNFVSQDTTYSIVENAAYKSGALCGAPHPCIAWSDNHSIFLNAYYDTIWSHPPVRISDTSLHDCINPDIVAENDSTVWVCYQNDGDIYVTRTSVPLGVSGSANNGERRPLAISLKSWPNPASNVIHFSYTIPNTHNSSVAIYDITGRLVKVLKVSNNQINWNCADNAGHKVASGVYFARLTSDGQETIKRISIIK